MMIISITDRMNNIRTGLFMLTNAASAILGMALSPFAVDPLVCVPPSPVAPYTPCCPPG
jgi:dipeptide/tripeptide permease